LNYEIVDIDKNNPFQEIAIQETGPCDDRAIQYFQDNGNEIKRTGYIANNRFILRERGNAGFKSLCFGMF